MSDRMDCYFVKFFQEEEHADQFIKGKLYLNRLSYFTKIEDECDGRPDTNEAVAMWWQPYDVTMTLNIPGVGETVITSKDLAAPVSMSFEYHDHVHVFCLYTVSTVSPESLDQQASLAEREAELQKQFRIDERCAKFGQFAVLVQVAPFLGQLKEAREALRRNGLRFGQAHVKYYDGETFHGEITHKEIPFWKQKKFSYQQEFRICVQTNTQGDDPLTIDIGDISHLCVKVDSSRLIEAFKHCTVSLHQPEC